MTRDPLHDALLRGELRGRPNYRSEDARPILFPVLVATALLVSAIYAFVGNNSSTLTHDVRTDGSLVRYELSPSSSTNLVHLGAAP
jgi:hypothetical protein